MSSVLMITKLLHIYEICLKQVNFSVPSERVQICTKNSQVSRSRLVQSDLEINLVSTKTATKGKGHSPFSFPIEACRCSQLAQSKFYDSLSGGSRSQLLYWYGLTLSCSTYNWHANTYLKCQTFQEPSVNFASLLSKRASNVLKRCRWYP